MVSEVPGTEVRQTPNRIRREEMKHMLVRTFVNLHNEESGQDLIEYALVVALIALAATAGMSSLANGINSAFTKLNSILGAKIS
jgi:pilus assembly protein Flp/PilA